MTMRMGRNIVLQAASVLALTAGMAFADEIGVGADVDADAEVGANVDAGADVAADGDVEATVEGDGDVAATVETEGDGDATARVSGSGGTSAEAAVEAGAEGDVTADTDASAQIGVDGWTLADFHGKRVEDTSGNGVGTVESVAVDASNEVHLVTALDADDQDGNERVIPLDAFSMDASAETLVLASADAALEADMLSASADTFTMITSDAELQALLAAN